MSQYDPPDGPMTPDESAIVSSLDPEFVRMVDEALLSHASIRSRKVAFIVGTTMMDAKLRLPGLSDLFYASRVKELVKQGLLVAVGNLDYMRYSEVRLPTDYVPIQSQT